MQKFVIQHSAVRCPGRRCMSGPKAAPFSMASRMALGHRLSDVAKNCDVFSSEIPQVPRSSPMMDPDPYAMIMVCH